MKFSRFLTRHVPGFRLLPIRGAVGARQTTLFVTREHPLRPYCGPFDDHHVLILVRQGTVTFERGGERLTAYPGDALMIGRGDEGRLTFFPAGDFGDLILEITTFDERSMAKTLREDAAFESAALVEHPNPPTAFYFRQFARLIPQGLPLALHEFRTTITAALKRYPSGLPELFRKNFYERRWDLCIHLEQFAACSEGAKRAAQAYKGGARQLRRDCLRYIGVTAEAALLRRRCDLAAAWLRCGHEIDDVAKALGFSSTWEFECAFAGTKKRRCRDVQKMTPLSEDEPEALVAALLPFWWDFRTLKVGMIPAARIFQREIMSESLENAFIAHDPPLQRMQAQTREQRAEFTRELREKAADFFAMKTTGAEIIVPFFEAATNLAQAA